MRSRPPCASASAVSVVLSAEASMPSSHLSRRAPASISDMSRWIAKGMLAAEVTRSSVAAGRNGATAAAASSRRRRHRSAWTQAI